MLHSRDTAGKCYRRVENRAARLCTASNAFLHLAWCGSHTDGAYSSFGRTSALYARALVFCNAMRRVLQSVLEASPTTLDMWVRQVRSSERVTPRYYYLECLTGVSVWLCRLSPTGVVFCAWSELLQQLGPNFFCSTLRFSAPNAQ